MDGGKGRQGTPRRRIITTKVRDMLGRYYRVKYQRIDHLDKTRNMFNVTHGPGRQQAGTK